MNDQSAESLQLFFDGLHHVVAEGAGQSSEMDRLLAHRFNVFDYIKFDENGMTAIIRDLLDPDARHGQGDRFLRKWLKMFWPEAESWSVNRVRCESETSTRRRIDLEILFHNGSRLGLENKPWAMDQDEQIDHYLSELQRDSSARGASHRLLYLTPNGQCPSPKSCRDPATAMSTGHLRLLSLSGDLRRWLIDCAEDDAGPPRLRDFLLQFEQYLSAQFGEKPMSHVENFLLNNRESFDLAWLVHDAWKQLPEIIVKKFSTALIDEMKARRMDLVVVRNDFDVLNSPRPRLLRWESEQWPSGYSLMLEDYGSFSVGLARPESMEIGAFDDNLHRELKNRIRADNQGVQKAWVYYQYWSSVEFSDWGRDWLNPKALAVIQFHQARAAQELADQLTLIAEIASSAFREGASSKPSQGT